MALELMPVRARCREAAQAARSEDGPPARRGSAAPEHMGFRALRVLNDDVVAPGRGFSEHPHADVEIVSYVLAGALEDNDSIGTGSVLHTGDVQCMTAGRGVQRRPSNAGD